MIDIYAFMVLKRSLSLIFGFSSMIRNENFLCAAPLVRLQIDNLLRFRAAFLVDDQDNFVNVVIHGKHVRHFRDRSGKKLTDAYLKKHFSEEYPWLEDFYNKASGYIHLSELHFLNTIRKARTGQDGVIEAYIGPDDQMVSNEVYLQAIEEMIIITYSLLETFASWVNKKEEFDLPLKDL